jgi:hypothetical protein
VITGGISTLGLPVLSASNCAGLSNITLHCEHTLTLIEAGAIGYAGGPASLPPATEPDGSEK